MVNAINYVAITSIYNWTQYITIDKVAVYVNFIPISKIKEATIVKCF